MECYNEFGPVYVSFSYSWKFSKREEGNGFLMFVESSLHFVLTLGIFWKADNDEWSVRRNTVLFILLFFFFSNLGRQRMINGVA